MTKPTPRTTRREDRVESIDRVYHCGKCDADRRVAVIYRDTLDGGELVILRCVVCSSDYPAAKVTRRGVRVRARLQRAKERKQSAARDREVAKLEAELQRHVSRAYSVPEVDGEARDVRHVGSDRGGD